jgi:ribonuclease HI
MKEIAEGYHNTTKNRLDLISILIGLEALNQKCEVKLLTNSMELVKIMSERSWEKWQATKLNNPYELHTQNADLWEKLLKLYEIHSVEFKSIESDIEKYYEKRCEKLAINAFYKSK